MSKNRLKYKIEEVKSIFPWYEELVNGGDYSDIKTFPLMTAEVLGERYYSSECEFPHFVYRTSGTSGKGRKKIFYSHEDEKKYIETKVDVFRKVLEDENCKELKAFVDVGTGHAANTAKEIFTKLGISNRAISYEEPINKHIEELKDFKPDVLYTMPSILDGIIEEIGDPSVLGIKKILLVGEVASEQWIISKVSKAFNISVDNIIDTYGSIELGIVAYYSIEHKRYVVVDDLIAEVVDISEIGGDSVGSIGKSEGVLVITSFMRDFLPAIRFVTYDVVRDFRIMNIDGEEKFTFKSIVKRVGNEMKHGEKISFSDIENAVFKYVDNAIVKARVENNRLKVLISTNKSISEEIMQAIKNEIQKSIPDIDTMIRNRILEKIQVELLVGDFQEDKVFVKKKKVYTK